MILRGILGKRLEDYYLTNGNEKKQDLMVLAPMFSAHMLSVEKL